MALTSKSESNHGGGISRGRSSPPGSVFDAVNALINDEGLLYKRGGGAFYSASNAGTTLKRVVSAHLPGPATERVVTWNEHVYVLDGALAPVDLLDAGALLGRPAIVGGMLIWPNTQDTAGALLYYGGSLSTGSAIAEGTITVTNGSATVTKAGGTSWVTLGVAAGHLLEVVGSGGGYYGIVRTVAANSLTLVDPWANATTVTANYTISPFYEVDFTDIPNISALSCAGSVGSPARLLLSIGNRVYQSARGNPRPFDVADFHELPPGTIVNGIEGVGDTGLIFTSGGVWAISNLSLDPVDAFGNIQQAVQRINGDIALWGEAGLAAYLGGAIVPATDDIHMMTADGSAVALTATPENEKVRRLYRSYTKEDGYQPGGAAIHNGHLFMPITDGTTVVDVLVCRLDRDAAWTRWSGHAAGLGYAIRPGNASDAPKLLGVAAQRVTDLTGTLDPVAGNSADADASVPSMTIITRDYPLSSGGAHGFCQRVRVRAEVTDDANGATAAAAATVEFSSDQDGGSFTALTEKGEQDGGPGWATSTGAKYWWASVGKRRERIRFRFVFSGGTASTVLRSITTLTRPSGKQ